MVLYLLAEVGQWGYELVRARQYAGQRVDSSEQVPISRRTRVTSSS
jgi:hypothetical protein